MVKKAKGKDRTHDKYYHLAKEQGYRSRAAFKLIQLNQKYDFFSSARAVIDLCAAPGGWLQVASKYMPVSSVLVGIDLVPIKPIPNVYTVVGDITDIPKCKSELRKYLKDWKADVVLHDGSPNVGTAWAQDAYTQSILCMMALRLAVEFLAGGGSFVCKVFRSSEYNALLWVFQQFFDKVESTKPKASRSTSAEIYVVCRGYKAPKKVDPKLLDPRYVFQEVEPAATKEVTVKQLVEPTKRRNREGYDESTTDSGGLLVYQKKSIAEFIQSDTPLQLLMRCSEFTIDEQAIALLRGQKLAAKRIPKDVAEICTDLKVLGRKEFESLLKWRMAVRTLLQLDTQPQAEAVAGGAAGEDGESRHDVEGLVDAELDARIAALRKRTKHERKKLYKRLSKYRQRLALKMNVDGLDWESHADADLFALERLKNRTALAALETKHASMDIDTDTLPDTDIELGDDIDTLGEADGEDNNGDEEGAYDKLLEGYLDTWYQQYLDAQAARGIKPPRKGKKEKRQQWQDVDVEDVPGAIAPAPGSQGFVPDLTKDVLSDGEDGQEEDGEAQAEDDEGEPQEEEEANPLLVGEEALAGVAALGDQITPSKRAAMWFSKPLFEGVDDEQDAPTQPMMGVDNNDSSSDEKEEEGTEAQQDEEMPTEVDERALESSEKKLKRGKKRKRDERDSEQGGEEDDFEVVPQEKPEVDQSSSDDDEEEGDKGGEAMDTATSSDPEEDMDEEEKAEAWALGHLLLRKKSRNELIDNAYNRYAFNDDIDSLPRWFVDDESKHNRPELPLTKELAAAIRQRLVEINARPIKKVVEAKARKKLKAVRKLEKLRAQAEGIANDSEMSEAQKLKTIEKMYRGQLAKMRPNRVYIVSRKFSQKSAGGKHGPRVKGSKVKLVDPRMKKDLKQKTGATKVRKNKRKRNNRAKRRRKN